MVFWTVIGISATFSFYLWWLLSRPKQRSSRGKKRASNIAKRSGGEGLPRDKPFNYRAVRYKAIKLDNQPSFFQGLVRLQKDGSVTVGSVGIKCMALPKGIIAGFEFIHSKKGSGFQFDIFEEAASGPPRLTCLFAKGNWSALLYSDVELESLINNPLLENVAREPTVPPYKYIPFAVGEYNYQFTSAIADIVGIIGSEIAIRPRNTKRVLTLDQNLFQHHFVQGDVVHCLIFCAFGKNSGAVVGIGGEKGVVVDPGHMVRWCKDSRIFERSSVSFKNLEELNQYLRDNYDYKPLPLHLNAKDYFRDANFRYWFECFVAVSLFHQEFSEETRSHAAYFAKTMTIKTVEDYFGSPGCLGGWFAKEFRPTNKMCEIKSVEFLDT